MTAENKICVLFDLDGTLADTAPDLAFALNETLKHFGRQALPYEAIRPVVSHGGVALIRLGFGIDTDNPDFEAYRQFLLDVYQNNICKHTRLFDGMDEVLNYLETSNIPWGIVTNKPSWLTDPLMDAMQLTQRAACIVSGDTCEQKKPHPMPIHHACEQAGVIASDCYYVGDAARDIEAGRTAGCTTITALFGYIDENDNPAHWHADHMIETPLDVIALLQRQPI